MRILIVDDDPVTRQAMLVLMEQFGECQTVENGSQAVAAFSKALDDRALFDLITIDINVPKMGGIEVLTKIRATEKENNIPGGMQAIIMMVTNCSDRNYINACLVAGCDHYVLQPIDAGVLERKIERISGRTSKAVSPPHPPAPVVALTTTDVPTPVALTTGDASPPKDAPAGSMASAAQDAATRKIAQGNLKGLRVLIIDDLASMRRIIRHIFLRDGNCQDIKEADDGDKALALIQSDPILFDLIICDWGMPRMKGVDLLRMIREDERLKDIPFIMVTCESDDTKMVEAAEIGVNGYIIKPFGTKTLMDKVIQVLVQKRKPSRFDTHLQQAMIHLESLELDKAMKEVKAAKTIWPDSSRTYYVAGLVFEAQKEYQKAKQVYSKAIELSPKFLRAHERLSSIYVLLGEPDKATEHLKRAVEISPHNINLQMELGQKLLEKGDVEAARIIFQDARSLATLEAAHISRKIGDIFMNHGWFDDALTAFEDAADLLPGDPNIHNQMGIVYRKLNEWDKALECYRWSLELAPDDENIHFNIGLVYMEQKKKYLAEDHFRKALELYPEFHEAAAMIKRIEMG
ncbi:MAG: response regulator [Deltaproteobacteria bacterium]|nr:response regulator [Deltaproteobacteria bacterium]